MTSWMWRNRPKRWARLRGKMRRRARSHFPPSMASKESFEAIDGGKCDLALRRIFPRSLAQRFGRFLHIQDVIHNLESQTDVLAVLREGFYLRGLATRRNSAHANA